KGSRQTRRAGRRAVSGQVVWVDRPAVDVLVTNGKRLRYSEQPRRPGFSPDRLTLGKVLGPDSRGMGRLVREDRDPEGGVERLRCRVRQYLGQNLAEERRQLNP